MRKGLLVFFALMAWIVGCDDATSSSSEPVLVSTKDTLVIKDTMIVSKLDTVVLSKQDTVVLSKQDTLVHKDTLVQKDTLIVVPQDTGTGILDFNPESSMIPKLENLVHQKRDGTFALREKQIVLLHFTDIHGYAENLKRIKEFYDHYSKYIDVVIHTGDALYTRWTDSYDFWDESGASGFLNLIGNHDIYIVDEAGNRLDVTLQQEYERFFAPYVSEWDVVLPQNAAEEGLMYYYKDIDKGEGTQRAKLRLVFLDEYHWTDGQKEWLEGVLDDAKANDFAVIICRHQISAVDKYVNCPFVSLETFATKSLTEAETAVDDFIAAGGEFVMWLGGHIHQDVVGTIQAHPHQIVFNGETASLNHPGYNDAWRKKGTKSQDSFTLIGVDRFEKVIRFIRVGADVDRYERKKETMSINYATTEMIY